MSVDFIDSNVFIYLFDEKDPRKRQRAERVVQQALESGTAVVSFQVVQETLNILVWKLRRAATRDDAQRFLDKVMVPLWRVMPSTALYQRALDVKARYAFSFYDSLIVAAALEANCTRLLSEDLQDQQRIDGLIIENPFLN